ncbi:MAG: flagellar M-ring protein FliF [Lachnospiraceae bacterium]|nr:flagellar M-ring protein FliF [Lachnospiraceae bacterium]
MLSGGISSIPSKRLRRLLKDCSDSREAAEIVELLESNSIKYKTNEAGTRITVPKKNLAEANLAIASSGITPTAYDIDTALAGGFTVTEADKQKRYQKYLQDELANDFLTRFNAVKSAVVTIHLAENDGTLLSKQEETTCTVALDVEGDFDSENAAFIAKAIAGALGLSNTDNIVIMDMDANLLFSGAEDKTVAGNASSQLGVKTEAESLTNTKVRNVLAGTGQFGDIRVASNLDIDFSNSEHTTHTYTPADGQSQGLLAEEEYYTSESQGGANGDPGTDSNGETTYQYRTGEYSTSTIEEYYKKYLPNEDLLYTQIPAGVINYAKSSVGVSSTEYIVVKEDEVKRMGLLDGISWDEYKQANSEKRQLEVSEEMVTLVANATGVPGERINIVAFEENVFVDSEGLAVDMTDVVQIILIILILALLAIVVLKSMRTQKEEEQPEELSVENLLQSNPEPVSGLEDIEMEESSETKKAIEKFVDENPEAVAVLLRNWLNEEWG